MAESTDQGNLTIIGNAGVEKQQNETSGSVDIEEQQIESTAAVEAEDQQHALHVDIEDDQKETTGSGSDTLEYICQPCSSDNKQIQAAGFCVDCSELLCTDCFNYHPKPFTFRNHRLVDIEQVKTEKDFPVHHDVCNKMCAEHRGKVIEYYCTNDQCLACGVCINLDHKNCPNVQYIPKVSESMANGGEFSSVVQKLDNIVLKAKEIVEAAKSNTNKTRAAYKKVLDDVEKVKKEVIEAFEKLQKEMEKEALTLKDEHVQKMDVNIGVCEEIKSNAETMASSFESLKERGQHCNLFVSMKAEQESITTLEERLDQVADDNCIGHYLFQPSHKLQKFLKHNDTLGKLLQQKTNIATKVDEIFVRAATDTKTCSIYGLSILPDSNIVISDHANKKVKLVDLAQSKVIHALEVPNEPWSVTSKGTEIAVIITDDKKVYLLKVKDGMLCKEGEINMPDYCYGIAYTDDNFVVSLMFPERLALIDRQGNVLKALQTDNIAKNLFQDIRSISTSWDQSTIYVPDYGNSSVRSVSLPLQEKNLHEEKYIIGARGVAIDKNGRVFVCYADSDMICQMTPDLKDSFLVLSSLDGLDSPLSLTYCSETEQLFVGMLNDNIQVYKILV